MRKTMRPAAGVAVCAALAVVAGPRLAAQRAAADPAWHVVMTGEDGTTVAIDTAFITRSDTSAFTVRTLIRFAAPVRLDIGAEVDREVDLEGLDCVRGRVRGLSSELYADTQRVLAADLAYEWVDVPEMRRAVFDARCGWLLASSAAARSIEFDAERVDQAPELANRMAAAAAVARAYPPELRRTSESGKATVLFRILGDGRVDESSVEVLRSSNPEFGRAARRAVLSMRFHPARLKGVAVPVWATLPIHFTPNDPGLEEAQRPGSPLRASPPEIPPSMRPE